MVADAAYAGKELRRLPAAVTWTTRLRKDAALYALPGPRTGKRGRPRVKGKRLASLAILAGTACFAPVTVRRYGKTATVQAAVITCLWHGVFGARPVQVVLLRDRAAAGYDLALATTDLAASPAQVIERYASRWSIEVAIEDAKQIFGAGQARNRLPAAVHRTLPFTLACQSLAMLWYATAGHHPADVAGHRARAPCRAVHRRHDRQAPPGPHRRQISAGSPPRADPGRNPRHPAGLGRHRRLTAKVESPARVGYSRDWTNPTLTRDSLRRTSAHRCASHKWSSVKPRPRRGYLPGRRDRLLTGRANPRIMGNGCNPGAAQRAIGWRTPGVSVTRARTSALPLFLLPILLPRPRTTTASR